MAILQHDQRLGLTVVIAILLAIATTVGLLLHNRQQEIASAIAADGAALTRLVANLPLNELRPNSGQASILKLLQQTQGRSNFAWAAIVDTRGVPLGRVSSAQQGIPDWTPGQPLPLWLGERELPNNILEFYAPVIENGEVAAYVRAAWRLPKLSISLLPLPEIAKLALPVFLLAPLIVFLLRMETAPMQQANGEMISLMRDSEFNRDGSAAEMRFGEFVDTFKEFVGIAEQRVKDLESNRLDSLAHSKMISWQKRCAYSALDALPDGIIIMDESGVATYSNNRVEAMTGVKPETILGARVSEWTDDSGLIALLNRYCGNVTRLRRPEQLEMSSPVDGSRHLQVRVFPLGGGKNAGESSLVVFHDNTNEILARRARDEFIGNVAHELKSPLNVIRMQTELVADSEAALSSESNDSLNVVLDETERLAKLINDLLSITKIESGSMGVERTAVRLEAFLADVVATNERSARARKISVELDVESGLSQVSIDKDLMRVAINNLLSNAIKYNHEGGTVRVVVGSDEQSMTIRVSDTGIGIEPSEREAVFEKFYRAQDAGRNGASGHGLGLALARDIVVLHGGRLRLESEVGEGSSFIIELRKTEHLLREAV